MSQPRGIFYRLRLWWISRGLCVWYNSRDATEYNSPAFLFRLEG